MKFPDILDVHKELEQIEPFPDIENAIRASKVKPFTLLPITLRLSCCLKLTSFTVLPVFMEQKQKKCWGVEHGTKHYGNF